MKSIKKQTNNGSKKVASGTFNTNKRLVSLILRANASSKDEDIRNLESTYYFSPDQPKPFKNPKFSSYISSKRKWKNLKSIQTSMEVELSPVDQPTCKSSTDHHIPYVISANIRHTTML